ncbi:hypothetical protein MKEN_00753400 [Mycena kentingensis (nom. inval.)]|nr:hypothetical protein MKEN_00753400 [Mycena kentingensis (nom. inval.)]
MLGRNNSTWRIANVCPACTYKLKHEPSLKFSMFVAMDGNDSLKRVLRKEAVDVDHTVWAATERDDDRDASDGYYASRDKVDGFGKEKAGTLLPTDNVEDNPCATRWKNMINDTTAKSRSLFDETGLFLSTCRHSFVIVAVDMVRSGELSKYALAVVDIILECLDDDVGLGYDIGCHFKTTLANSKLGPLAFAKRLRCLVGSFHGHAHNRLCQLSYLATYIEGLGREDLETLERFFSRSNALARSCRNASRFHRQQEITTYLKYTDVFETYPNLSQVICTRYKSALKLLADEPAVQQLMRDEGIVAQDFDDALREEREHLLALKTSSTKPVETLEISYVKSLQKLQASSELVAERRSAARRSRGDDAPFVSGRTKAEIDLRHAQERLDRDAKVVESLEVSLDIVNRWQTNWPQYKKAEHDALLLRYQQSLDRLELLLVQRFLEFTRMNQSGTGYQLRQHLGKAMQVRSKTIRAALAVYNELAVLLDRPPLEWDEIVNITFLSDFDLLRDSTSNIHNRRWARPAFRDLMHRYFRIVRAREEIVRLNVEIPRVLTWMRDDSDFLRQMEQSLRRVEGKSPAQIEGDLLLAVQLQDYAQQKHRFDDVHRRRFHDLSKLPGFTGSLELGVARCLIVKLGHLIALLVVDDHEGRLLVRVTSARIGS